jgi:hypothetical protein
MGRQRMEWMQFGSGKTYFHLVHRPLQCLIFIAPLLIFYQVASIMLPLRTPGGAGVAAGGGLIAFQLMLDFFAFFGAFGNVLPLLAVVAILLFWHLARKDPWSFDPPVYAGMAAESLIWGVPFFIIGLAILQHLPAPALALVPGAPHTLPWRTEVVLSVGAGIYEELLFRLIAINLLSMLLIDAFEMKPASAMPLIIVGSAVLFSLYHYLGTEHFAWDSFAFRTALGIYLAGVYVYRGFGIAVGAHTVYDLIRVIFIHT